jgi:hypothetical protein
MPKTYNLFYSGTAPGQADQIERAGWVFKRGCSTEVPKDVHDLLKNEPGFASGKNPPAAAEPAESED